MKIGIFTDTYKPQINGVVTSVSLMEQKLKENGHQPYIFTVTHPEAKTSVIPDADNVYRVASVKFWGNTDHRIAKIYSQRIMNTVRELGIELIHSHAPFSLGLMGHLIARRLRIPEVHTYHTMLSDYTYYVKFGNLLPKEAAENYSRVFCNRVNAVIAPTEKVHQALVEYGVKKPIYVIPTGIDLPPFYQKIPQKEINNLKQALGIKDKDKVLIFVGRIAKEKSIDKLMNYHRTLVDRDPNYKLVIVGTGDHLEELKELSNSLSLNQNVIFTGRTSYDSLPRYYQMADCFVTASTSETQGLVVLEAAASKLPIVAIEDESYFGIVKNNVNGIYYHTEDEYISSIEKIFSDNNLRQNMGANSLGVSKDFSSDNFYNRIIQVYEETIKNFKKTVI